MIEIKGHDRYLDPPDDPLRSDCDGCGCEFPTSELTKTGTRWNYKWLCEDCLEEHEANARMEE